MTSATGDATRTRPTSRQRHILEVIERSVGERGYPPSVREIAEEVGLRSPSSVHAQLAALEEAGALRRDPTRPRAMQLMPAQAAPSDSDEDPAGQPEASGTDTVGNPVAGGFTARHTQPSGPTALPSRPDEVTARRDTARTTVADVAGAAATREGSRDVPLLGEIAAGAPVVADEHVEDTLPLPQALVGSGTLFALRVRGDSMVDAGIHHGDLVVVREQPSVNQGELCAAMIEGEATVKAFRRTPDGTVFLDPANDSYEPIPMDPTESNTVLGRVTAVLRSV